MDIVIFPFLFSRDTPMGINSDLLFLSKNELEGKYIRIYAFLSCLPIKQCIYDLATHNLRTIAK